MTNFFKDIVDFALPRFCVMCGERLTSQERCICLNCLRHLPLTNSHLHPENEIEKLFWFHLPIVRASSFLFYEGEGVRNMIHLFKYKSRPDIGQYLATLMAQEYQKSGFFDTMDVVVPVPLHWKKQFQRGYNQCHYIAQGIHDITGIPVEKHAVRRIKNNKSQAKLHISKRQENVKSIFRVVRPERLQGKHVLLIDDILTTGTTILSCAQEIAKLPNTRISIVSLAYAGEKFMLSNNLPKDFVE